MTNIYNKISERMELPVSLLEADETVSQLISILSKAGRSEATVINALCVYLSALRQNLRTIV